MKLRHRVTVERCPLAWANSLIVQYHYLHRPVHPRAHPFAYAVKLDGQAVGCIVMATPHFVRQRELFGYPGLPTKWQVLMVSRMWLDPAVQGRQSNGHASNVASCALSKMLKRVQGDWLEHHPPRFLDQPYHIRLILAYADTGVGHEGTIYKAANFQLWSRTNNSRPRHGSTPQGNKHNGNTKILYVYRLPEPKWEIPIQQLCFSLQLQEETTK